MKKLYLIGGTMGIGKTSVCNELLQLLPDCVFLDGDWCWNAHPFTVNEETKTMVLNNIRFMLNSFLHCSVYENVVFCWVMHEQSIIDSILNNIDLTNCEVRVISLTCSPITLQSRLENDVDKGIRTTDVIKRSLAKLSLYDKLDTIKVDTDGKSVRFVAEIISHI